MRLRNETIEIDGETGMAICVIFILASENR